MIKEIVEKDSGAILFKEDEDGQRIEALEKEVESLRSAVFELEKRIKSLSKLVKK